MLTEIYLCHACSCQEILRAETAGQEQCLRGVLGQRQRRGGEAEPEGAEEEEGGGRSSGEVARLVGEGQVGRCGWALAARVRGYEQLVREMPWPNPSVRGRALCLEKDHTVWCMVWYAGGMQEGELGSVSLGQGRALAQAMVQRMRRPSAEGDYQLFYSPCRCPPDGTPAGGAEEPETPKLHEQAAVAYGFALLAGAAGSSFGSADVGGASLTEALYGILEPGVR
jgi:hypothetical protein